MSGDLSVAFYKTIKHHSHCLVCHTKKNITFHHVDPEDKVSELHKVARNYSFKTLVDEFNKCVPLCWGHHAEVHKGLREGWMRGLTDKHKMSHDLVARQFMPYLPYIAKKKPEIFSSFYHEHVQEAKEALAGIVKTQEKSLYPIDYINAAQMQPTRVWYDFKGKPIIVNPTL